MKTRGICGMLTVIMICCIPFGVKADLVKLQNKKLTGGVRSIQLDISHLFVNLENNVIHADFLFLLREVNISIVNSEGRQVYQQVVSPQTSSVDINLSGEERGAYTVYFSDVTGVCLYGEFVIQ